ncbi:MAG: hypothetical protein ACP5QU_06030 [Anaerolineae bacterium]
MVFVTILNIRIFSGREWLWAKRPLRLFRLKHWKISVNHEFGVIVSDASLGNDIRVKNNIRRLHVGIIYDIPRNINHLKSDVEKKGANGFSVEQRNEQLADTLGLRAHCWAKGNAYRDVVHLRLAEIQAYYPTPCCKHLAVSRLRRPFWPPKPSPGCARRLLRRLKIYRFCVDNSLSCPRHDSEKQVDLDDCNRASHIHFIRCRAGYSYK